MTHPLTGLQILPASLTLIWLLTYVFLAASGWTRGAPHSRVLGTLLPRPGRWTGLAGIGASCLLIAVPLSFTFKSVSIPYVQLLMRGDLLLIAPFVDLVARRKVHWWSWAALLLVLAGLVVTVRQRGGVNLPALCWLALGVYVLGYFVRLLAMSRVSKTGEPGSIKRYYAEEQLVATPFALLVLGATAWLAHGADADQLRWGFTHAWSSPALMPLAAIAALAFCQSLLAAAILLDARENTFCVAMERSASVLGGFAAALMLALAWRQPMPSSAEAVGAGLLIVAMLTLTIAPRLVSRQSPSPATQFGQG